MIVSTRGHLGIDDADQLVRFGHVRRGRGSDPVQLGPMAARSTGDLVPEWLRVDYRELLDRWHDGPSHAEYRDEVMRVYTRGLT
jgi:hypothetical protein